MSLNYNLGNIDRTKADWKDEKVWPLTNALIWATMSVGMNKITEDNWQEFFTRLRQIENVSGTMLSTPDGDMLLEPDVVRNHIGLSTNVSPWTDAKFGKVIASRAREEAQASLEIFLREEAGEIGFTNRSPAPSEGISPEIPQYNNMT